MILFLIIAAIITLVSLAYIAFNSKDLPRWQTVAMVVSSPLLVAFIYSKIGTPQALNLEQTLTASTHQTEDINNLLSRNQLGPKQIQRAIESLRAKVDENPNDIESLSLLANTYLITDQSELAVLTLEKLISLGQTDPDTLIKTADVYTFIEQGVINQRAQQLLETAIAQNSNHPQGLWLLGMAAIQNEQEAQAKEYWSRLLPLVANTPQEQQLNSILADLEKRISNADEQAPATTDSEISKNIIEKRPSSESQITAQQENSKPEIKIDVALAQELRESNPLITDQDTVFVFARAIDGPKLPLAVKRITVADLPISVTLTEQDAMLPQATIAQFQDIQISAKISKSGNPTIKEGDIESNQVQINTSALQNNYQLTIK